MSDKSVRQSLRWPLVVASIVVAVEAAALAASAIVTAALIGAGHQHDSLDAWLVVAFAGVCAIGLWWAWRGLVRRRRWARSPAVLVQLLALPVAYNAFGDGAWWLGGPLLVCAVLGLVGLFAPSTTDALLDTGEPTPTTSRTTTSTTSKTTTSTTAMSKPATSKPATSKPATSRQRHSSTSKPSRN